MFISCRAGLGTFRPEVEIECRRNGEHQYRKRDDLRLPETQNEDLVHAEEGYEEPPQRVQTEIENDGHSIDLEPGHCVHDDSNDDEKPQLLVDRRGVGRYPEQVIRDEGGGVHVGETPGQRRGAPPRVPVYDVGELADDLRHRESEGSAYYRHYYMGLIDANGRPKAAYSRFGQLTARFPELGICQWFHFQDPRLPQAGPHLRALQVRHLRTGLSWADWYRPGAAEWFDEQMERLQEFAVTLTLCFTPAHLGLEPHYASPPREPEALAEFALWVVERYGRSWLEMPLAGVASPGWSEGRLAGRKECASEC